MAYQSDPTPPMVLGSGFAGVSVGEGYGCGMITFTPQAVPGLVSAVSIASGYDFDCAVLAGGEVVCWANNGSGQLGDGTTTSSSTPVAVVGLP
jgi:hypothetical protein